MKQSDLMSSKPKKVCMTLNFIEHLLILLSTIAGCVLNFFFALLVGIFISISISAVGLKLKKHKSVIICQITISQKA